jgi:hypothetical protein
MSDFEVQEVDSLIARIMDLSDQAAQEAVNLLDVGLGDQSDDELYTEVAKAVDRTESEVREELAMQVPADVAALARLTLVMSASEGRAEAVRRAIDATGQKAVVLEIAVVGLLALAALHIVVTGGVKEANTNVTATVSSDGTITTTTSTTKKVSTVSESLAGFARALLFGSK